MTHQLPPKILREKVIKIFDQSHCSFSLGNFEADLAPLSPILKKLGNNVPEDLQEYLETCLIKGGCLTELMSFYDVEMIKEESQVYEPGCYIVHQGFLCLANEGDGSQFSYCTETGKIFHIDAGDYGDIAEETRDLAWNSWPTLTDFLDYIIAELENRKHPRILSLYRGKQFILNSIRSLRDRCFS